MPAGFSLPELNSYRYADFAIGGFDSSEVAVYEVTDTIGGGSVIDAVRLTGVTTTLEVGKYTVRFRMNDIGLGPGELRRFVAIGNDSVPQPASADFARDRVSTLRSDSTQADLIVIAHPDLIDSSCSEGGNPCDYDVDCTGGDTDRCELTVGSALDNLLAHRASQGISSRVARIVDVQDEFNDGLYGPQSIKNFLAPFVRACSALNLAGNVPRCLTRHR